MIFLHYFYFCKSRLCPNSVYINWHILVCQGMLTVNYHAVQSNYVMLLNTPISTNVPMMKLYIVKIDLQTIYQNNFDTQRFLQWFWNLLRDSSVSLEEGSWFELFEIIYWCVQMETVQGYVLVRNFHSILDQLHLQQSVLNQRNKNQDT